MSKSLELVCFWCRLKMMLVSKKCELVCFGVKIMKFVLLGVKKSGISVFLVSVENGAGVNKVTNMTYDCPVWKFDRR